MSFLSLHSHPGTTSPTLRGQAARENLLCQIVPPPPGDVDFSFVQDTNNPDFKTVRQRLSVHRENPTCAGCHSLTDPIGLTLEVFDTSGVYRTTENGAPIDPSGELNGKAVRGDHRSRGDPPARAGGNVLFDQPGLFLRRRQNTDAG